MKKLKFGLVLGALCLLGTSGFSQEDCASLQCDCANLEDTADAGALALCKYYEKAMKEACAEGGGDFKCHATHKGPNANTKLAVAENKTLKNKPVKKDVSNETLLPKVNRISDIKYCNQLIPYLKQEGTQFGNIRIEADSRKFSYFKEVWAYDYQGAIYAIVAMSKGKNSGFQYKLDVQYKTLEDYQYYVFCNISPTTWRKLSDVCNDCNLDQRYEKYLKSKMCDCL